MQIYGLQQSNLDHKIFFKHQQGNVTTLIIYVDDIIITRNDEVEISMLQKQLDTKFEMNDL